MPQINGFLRKDLTLSLIHRCKYSIFVILIQTYLVLKAGNKQAPGG